MQRFSPGRPYNAILPASFSPPFKLAAIPVDKQ